MRQNNDFNGDDINVLSMDNENLRKIFEENNSSRVSQDLHDLQAQNKKLTKLYNQSLNNIKILQEALEGKL